MSPNRPLPPCRQPSCPHPAVRGTGRCEGHVAEYRRKVEASRPTAIERGYGAEHRRQRAELLAVNPYCMMCLAEGRETIATVADHVVPKNMGGSPDLMVNGQGLCTYHHNAKRANESRMGKR